MDSLKAIATRQNLLGLIQSEQNPATIRSQNTEIWGTPTRTVENQQLMFDDNGLRNDGPHSTRPNELQNSGDQMDEQDNQMGAFANRTSP